MISWILQKPWHIGIGGGVFAALTAYAALRTQQRAIWRTAQVIALATVALVVLSVAIDTEEEDIRRSIYAAARAVERGDLDALVSYIHPDHPRLRNRARAEMEMYKIGRVSIKSNLMVTIDRSKQPPRALATFNVVVQGSDPNSLIGTRNVPRYVELTFEKYKGDWKVVGFEHFEPFRSMRKNNSHGLPQYPDP